MTTEIITHILIAIYGEIIHHWTESAWHRMQCSPTQNRGKSNKKNENENKNTFCSSEMTMWLNTNELGAELHDNRIRHRDFAN